MGMRGMFLKRDNAAIGVPLLVIALSVHERASFLNIQIAWILL
jgi:hypothetical protein